MALGWWLPLRFPGGLLHTLCAIRAALGSASLQMTPGHHFLCRSSQILIMSVAIMLTAHRASNASWEFALRVLLLIQFPAACYHMHGNTLSWWLAWQYTCPWTELTGLITVCFQEGKPKLHPQDMQSLFSLLACVSAERGWTSEECRWPHGEMWADPWWCSSAFPKELRPGCSGGVPSWIWSCLQCQVW